MKEEVSNHHGQTVLLTSKFCTENNHYIYDTYSNEILKVSGVAWDIVEDYLQNPGDRAGLLAKFSKYEKAEVDKAIKDIEEGRRSGYIQPAGIKKMNFYESHEEMIGEIKHKIKSLGLENTTGCNFRCKYCAFSHHYPGHRTHGSQNMDWNTARNAVDLFLRHSSQAERKNIGFWGGEPLMNFAVIRAVVDYVGAHYPDEEVIYSFTTNGSLLTDEIIEFLIKHKFSLQVTLNGPRHIHDKYRVDRKGKGTFDGIMRGLRSIRLKDKGYYDDHINFVCNLVPNTDYAEVASFFSENELFKDKTEISLTSVDSSETTFFREYGDYSVEQSRYIDDVYFEAAVNGKLEKERVIKEFNQDIMLKIYRRCRHNLGERITPNGCCVPMLKKMHVDVDGNIHVCERVPGNTPLGNVNENGIDYDLLVKVVEEYTANSIEDCGKCWAVRFCSLCFKHFMRNHKWYPGNRKQTCEGIRRGMLFSLKSYTEIIEENPRSFDYLNKIKIAI
jgi:uncharacterized protein